MAHGLQDHAERKNDGADGQCQRNPELDAPAERHAIESSAENDHQHGKADPVRVHVDLADVVVPDCGVPIESRTGFRQLAFRRTYEGSGQRASHLIERLVLDEQGIVKAIEHSKCCQGEAAEDQNFAVAAHG